ncbi:MAG TPA: phosphoribosylformylglycinamidine synthase subunit PurQ, partial [Phycisphaerae bacterium]|nr:phosphoribosylformylglycinamidine synthase subunit PurQ [Phycisphaerae bacterium]
AVLAALQQNDQIVFRYVDAGAHPAVEFPDNPNGSVDSIAGICDVTGRVLGLMPHPERFSNSLQHPFWDRYPSPPLPDGLQLFQNAVGFVRSEMSVSISA